MIKIEWIEHHIERASRQYLDAARAAFASLPIHFAGEVCEEAAVMDAVWDAFRVDASEISFDYDKKGDFVVFDWSYDDGHWYERRAIKIWYDAELDDAELDDAELDDAELDDAELDDAELDDEEKMTKTTYAWFDWRNQLSEQFESIPEAWSVLGEALAATEASSVTLCTYQPREGGRTDGVQLHEIERDALHGAGQLWAYTVYPCRGGYRALWRYGRFPEGMRPPGRYIPGYAARAIEDAEAPWAAAP